MRLRLLFPAAALTSIGLAAAAGFGGSTEPDSPAPHFVVKTQGFVPFADRQIDYRSQLLSDPIAKLQKRIESGEVVLRFDRQFGYLKSVLDALNVPVSSQALVFSKTSFQFPEITPANPRVLYYNDDVYVGRVPGGKFLEFVSFDPMQGAIFYIMDEHETARPRFERAEVDCVQCHVAPSTRNVPGVMLRSVVTKPSGYPAPGAPSYVTGQESPLNQRWGGWYVTAKSGAAVHMGNVTVNDPKQAAAAPQPGVASVGGRIQTAHYLTGSSDIVALMVLAHQTQMHNLITLTNYQTRLALAAANKTDGPSAEALSEEARQRFEIPAEQLVRYLLFTNEAPLEATVAGASGFTEEFASRGPRDTKGRSLRDFDLQTRMFKYPCSYLIYSEDFDAIP